MKKYVIGVDVGGTNIKLGVVASNGHVIARNHFPTKSFGSSRKLLIDAISQEVTMMISQAKIKKAQIAGVGIGLPGLINPSAGVVRVLPNIPGWRNVPLAKLLKAKLGLDVFIDNDVKVITLAESNFGAGKGVKHLVCLTLGTGVGAGLIMDGKLYRGSANAAGELGHMPINEHGPACNCGGWGCFERYVGNKSLYALASTMAGEPGLTTEIMYQRAKKGDKTALAFWHRAGELIGTGLVGIVNLLNPTLIVIGGGVSNNQEFLFPTIRKVLKRRCMSVQGKMVKVKRAHFKDDAGLIGAYVLVTDAKHRA